MVGWLRINAAPAEDLSSVPSTLVWWLTRACNSSSGDLMPSSGPQEVLHLCAYNPTQTYIHIFFLKSSLVKENDRGNSREEKSQKKKSHNPNTNHPKPVKVYLEWALLLSFSKSALWSVNGESGVRAREESVLLVCAHTAPCWTERTRAIICIKGTLASTLPTQLN